MADPHPNTRLEAFCDGVFVITWVNHHSFVGLLDKSSGPLVYANGFLLLTVVFMPFPTALVGEYLLTDHAAPAVVIYNSLTAVQAVSWILVTGTALKLTRDERAAALVRDGHRNGYFALVAYSLLALLAVWFPFAIAIVTALFWTYWLAFSLRAA